MKKCFIKAIVVALSLLMLLAGCSQTQEPNGTGDESQDTRWNDCKDIYTTVVTYSGEDDNKEYLKIAARSEQLLRLLEENIGAFVMDAYNYQSMDDDGTPLYEMNGLQYPVEIDPNGYCIRVSKNYFNFNPIETTDGNSLIEEIVYEDTTLNILVPEKYRPMEEQIIKAYRDDFYFQKVVAEEDYNTLAGIDTQVDFSEDDLSIHIIYVKDNQRYFTFNVECAKQTSNWITDPIVEIYTYNVHCNYAHSFMSQWVYFYSDSGSEENAFNEILPYVKECGAEASFQKVYSIYDEW